MSHNYDSCLSYHGPVVVFDLDDTLYSEASWACNGYQCVAKEISRLNNAIDPSLIFSLMHDALIKRDNPFNCLAQYLDSQGINYDLQQLLEIYRYNEGKLSLYPDARILLKRLARAGIRMGLITDGRSATQRAKIKALDIEQYFHPADIMISEESGADKTHPEPFFHFVHRYPEASRFFYLGDNTAKDFLHPRLLGWTTVLLLDRNGSNIHPQNTESSYLESNIDIVLTSLDRFPLP